MTPGWDSKNSEEDIWKNSFKDNSNWGFQSNFDEDAPESVCVTRASAKAKEKWPTSTNVSFVPLDDVSFHTEESASLWKYVVKCNIVDDKELADSTQECMELMDLLLKSGLDKTVLNLGPYYPQVVWEFIVNLSADFDDPTSIKFQNVHIGRHQFVISLDLINQLI